MLSRLLTTVTLNRKTDQPCGIFFFILSIQAYHYLLLCLSNLVLFLFLKKFDSPLAMRLKLTFHNPARITGIFAFE